MPRLASFLLALSLAGCRDDTTGGTAAATGTDASGSTSTGSTTGTTGTTGESPTSGPGGTGTTTSTTSSTSTTTGAVTDGSSSGDTSGTSGPIDPSTTSGTTTTTGEPPPPDACADQDTAPPAVVREAINEDPRFIQVYVNNIENLKLSGEQCPGDWTDLIDYMKTIEPSPDLFFVQQISDAAQLDLLVTRMTDDLPGIFEGVIADADPWTQLSPCGKEKEKQTNAIIFRSGRFSQVGDKHVWQSWANKNGECVRNNQARTRNVMVKLHDKIADLDITVASLHWSTSNGEGDDPACAEANILEADQKLHKQGFGGSLVIFGGDFNEPDRKTGGGLRPWYAKANGDDGGGIFNYRDPIYHACQNKNDLQTCLDDNWTIGGDRRIDMLFAQDGEGCRARTARAHTITFAEGDEAGGDPNLSYSEHRGIRAEFYYRD